MRILKQFDPGFNPVGATDCRKIMLIKPYHPQQSCTGKWHSILLRLG